MALNLQVLSAQTVPDKLAAWLKPQVWQKDCDRPILSLGKKGEFDDMHIFAPCVTWHRGKFMMWYPGACCSARHRVYNMGLATSRDGIKFEKHPASPVFGFGNDKDSILTPTLLRKSDGSLLLENGRLRMWFTRTDLMAKKLGLHSLHEITSRDGIKWSAPSPVLLEHAYAPTIIKENGIYRMWYTDVEYEPWKFRHALSKDGRKWAVHQRPVLTVNQKWEKKNLFYPTVIKINDVYHMWYGSYWEGQPESKTALGFAVSQDGLLWYKHPHNPVLMPDPQRPWESHFTTSQSVMRLADGSWRMWYATRKKPPFNNRYFAISTAKWTGPTTQP
jgi:predicted GH43/DUF377 family glycosyl hydrolase